MSMNNLIWFLIIGLIAGWLASIVMKGRSGLVEYLVIGVIGAFLGGWLFSVLGIAAGGLLGSILTAFVGAVVLLVILRAIRRA